MTKEEEIQVRARAILEVHRRKIKESLLEFMIEDSKDDEEDNRWKPAAHLNLLVDKLEQFAKDVKERKSPRLIICMPPRAGKSKLTSKKYPAWVLGNYSNWEIMLGAYSSKLAEEASRECRNTFAKHEELFSQKLAIDSNSVMQWALQGKSGKFSATSVGGVATGKGAHIAIIDDPIKNRAEAQSSLKRQNVIDWYKSTIRTRLAPGGGVIIVQTRWHDQDLAGYLMSEMESGEGETFDLVILSAIAEQNDILGRKEGEALWPERFPLDELERTKKAVGRLEWDSLYQQKPSLEGGGMFKNEYFQYFKLKDEVIIRDDDTRVPLSECRIFQTCDTAMKVAKQNDDTGIGTFALDKKGNLYLLNMFLDKIEIPDQYKKIKELHSYWNAQFSAVEDKSSGTGIIQEAQRESFPLKSLKAQGDKATRATTISIKFENRKVYFNKHLKNLTKIEEQLKKFPNAAHDEAVDVFAYAGILSSEIGNLNKYIGKTVVTA